MKVDLRNVTILCIDGVEPEKGLKALKYSMKDIDFAKAKLLSHIKPENIPTSIEFVEIEKLTYESYNSFVLHNLHQYVDTEFCLIIHNDGFVINPHLWDNDFLNYDYIGAPWKPIEYFRINRVGNGGFSLRSKKLMDLCKYMDSHGHEDITISLRYKSALEQHGCIFAPVEVAMKFSLESRIPECDFDLNNSFGFHGKGDPKSIEVHDGFYQQFQDKLKILEQMR